MEKEVADACVRVESSSSCVLETKKCFLLSLICSI